MGDSLIRGRLIDFSPDHSGKIVPLTGPVPFNPSPRFSVERGVEIQICALIVPSVPSRVTQNGVSFCS